MSERLRHVRGCELILLAMAWVLNWPVFMATTPADAAIVKRMEIDLTIDPNGLSMAAHVRMDISGDAGDHQLVCLFLKPTHMDYCREAGSDKEVACRFERLEPLQGSMYECTMDLNDLDPNCTLELEYSYSGADFYGTSLNPSTLDNFTLGQITADSVHSSHLFYYPYTDGLTGTARMSITVPQDWTAATVGVLQVQERLGGGQRFVYEIPYPSGMMPYPLAASRYKTQRTLYQNRVQVDVYSSAADVNYAKEKLEFLTTRLLPFLEGLMGNYPLPNLRVVETFLKEGNIGMATRGLVMFSQNMWFTASLGKSYDEPVALVLTDECAHQWNVYHVQFPNWLGEGLSDYTDNLYYERFVDNQWMAKIMPVYRQMYADAVNVLNKLKPLTDAGQTLEQAAEKLGLSVESIAPYWPYASAGEVAISDPRVFPTLYFIKGSLALQALRTQIDDEQFFAGFKGLFRVATAEPVTLDYCRECFEAAHGGSLLDFFQRWYDEPGLPAN